MNTLYLLGGPPRTAKSTIMAGLLKQKAVHLIASDAVQSGIRNIFVDDPYQLLRAIEFEGFAEHKPYFVGGGDKKPFSKKSNELELIQQALVGMLDHYSRNNISVAIEGSSITPEWTAGLQLPDYEIRAAFVGYTESSHVDALLEHAKANPHDWMNEWLERERGDATKIRAWAVEQADKCQGLKASAQQHGYAFFDISAQSFENYIRSVQNYFLKP